MVFWQNKRPINSTVVQVFILYYKLVTIHTVVNCPHNIVNLECNNRYNWLQDQANQWLLKHQLRYIYTKKVIIIMCQLACDSGLDRSPKEKTRSGALVTIKHFVIKLFRCSGYSPNSPSTYFLQRQRTCQLSLAQRLMHRATPCRWSTTGQERPTQFRAFFMMYLRICISSHLWSLYSHFSE